MTMSRNDAELFYDRGIPAGAIDPRAPDRFRPRNVVRIVNVKEKAEAVRARMAATMAMLADTETIDEGTLKRMGFTASEIAEHAGDALRAMMLANPTLLTKEFSA